jgi:hypothetical protein
LEKGISRRSSLSTNRNFYEAKHSFEEVGLKMKQVKLFTLIQGSPALLIQMFPPTPQSIHTVQEISRGNGTKSSNFSYTVHTDRLKANKYAACFWLTHVIDIGLREVPHTCRKCRTRVRTPGCSSCGSPQPSARGI